MLSTGTAAHAYPSANVSFSGHGYGHGRGLSQFGAVGYAVDYGWDWQRILDHYYGGTSLGTLGNLVIDVRLDASSNKDSIVYSAQPFTVAGMSFGANRAALIRKDGPSHFAVFESGSCAGAGGWASRGGVSGDVAIQPSTAEEAQGDNINQLLQVCNGDTIAYRGKLFVKDRDGAQRLLNTVRVENYLRGVVPRESPASWGSLGSGRGMHALRAQAVAARSYALVARFSYATTCDTISCQVYMGAYKNGEHIEYANSDAAVRETAGKVRLRDGGLIATEFSSSSGGYTAGGTFPAVVDEGDAYSLNTRHNWTTTVPVSTVESKYASIGSLQSIQITRRNGLGDMGGRVLDVVIRGSAGSTTDSGAGMRSKLGLNSDWFLVTNQPSGGVAGYHLLASDGGIFSFGNAQFYGSMGGKPLNRPIVGMASTITNRGYWNVASDGGIFAFGDAQFYGSMGGKPLNRPMVAMAAVPGGGGYWTVASDGGIFSFGNAQFYGSMGGKPLNRPIVGMAPTSTGRGYWLVASDGGIFAFGDAQFRGSTGGIRLNSPIVAMAPKQDGNGYWMVASDGGVFAYGSAGFYGSGGSMRLGSSVTGMSPTQTESGYVMSTASGVVYSFGDAPNFGDMTSVAGWWGAIQTVSVTKE